MQGFPSLYEMLICNVPIQGRSQDIWIFLIVCSYKDAIALSDLFHILGHSYVKASSCSLSLTLPLFFRTFAFSERQKESDSQKWLLPVVEIATTLSLLLSRKTVVAASVFLCLLITTPRGQEEGIRSIKELENLIVDDMVRAEPPAQSAQLWSSPREAALFFCLGALLVIVVLLIVIVVLWKFRKPVGLMKLVARSKSSKASPELFNDCLRTVRYFDLQTLKKATKNFNLSNLLGKGGFGPVYRGKLEDGTLIAVKKLSLEKSKQGESEFLSEVKTITSIQHKNLIRLLGCCADGRNRLLVYEFMKNGNLDHILYGESNRFLSWSIRFQIIMGIAKGLQYLHEESHFRIVHRDIKASNILLDDKFRPKIGDFGLARFFPEDQAFLSTTFAGTLGYTAPEYALRGELSEKADVYSFGVLVLEIIGCRKNTDLTLPSEMQYLPDYAWKLHARSRMLDLVDPKMRADGFVEKDVLQAIHVAFLCLQPHANVRPRMSEIVALLAFNSELNKSPMRPPFLERSRKKDQNFSWDTVPNNSFSITERVLSISKIPN